MVDDGSIGFFMSILRRLTLPVILDPGFQIILFIVLSGHSSTRITLLTFFGPGCQSA